MITVAFRSGNSDEPFKGLRFTNVAFPSDGLTIAVLRKEHEPLFDHGFSGAGDDAQPIFFLRSQDAGHADDCVASMLYCERFVATCAFADASGLKKPEGDLAGFKDELDKLYQRYGLSSGKHHSEQLFRDIERQGAALVKDKPL